MAAALLISAISAQALPLAPTPPSFSETDANESQQKTELIAYGDFNNWVVRHIKESTIIGGANKTIYAIGPHRTINGNQAYLGSGGSPWASSNVMAKVSGIYKTNLSVYPETRAGNGSCAKLQTHIEQCKVLGLVNIKVLAAGSIFLGQMIEPITSASNPMEKLNYGIPFNRRPSAIRFDYAVKLAGTPNRIRQNGVGGSSTVAGRDYADCVVLLQKRWEDAKGNIYAQRVGTMIQLFTRNTGWVNGATFKIYYGDITHQSYYQSSMRLNGVQRYAKNSKGKLKPIKEVGWAPANSTPTHICIQFDSSHGGAYVGSVGNTFWIDNVKLVY